MRQHVTSPSMSTPAPRREARGTMTRTERRQGARQGAGRAQPQVRSGEAGATPPATTRWSPPEAPMAMPRQALEAEAPAGARAGGLARRLAGLLLGRLPQRVLSTN